jgi:hypothetical protein
LPLERLLELLLTLGLSKVGAKQLVQDEKQEHDAGRNKA